MVMLFVLMWQCVHRNFIDDIAVKNKNAFEFKGILFNSYKIWQSIIEVLQ